MERTKRPALLALVRIFAEAHVPYAIIGGIALQVHQAEPRTTLLHEKLRATADPARRRSKRLQDLADAHALLESTPMLLPELRAAERALLDQLPP
jgi:hypothetical protein